ncbi:MAG: hypothetical protein H7831_19140 [Magnetococcus sp. WYHC-3]
MNNKLPIRLALGVVCLCVAGSVYWTLFRGGAGGNGDATAVAPAERDRATQSVPTAAAPATVLPATTKMSNPPIPPRVPVTDAGLVAAPEVTEHKPGGETPLVRLVATATECERRELPANVGEPARRERLVRAPSFKYPDLVIEEIARPAAAGAAADFVVQQAMVADRIMVKLRPGMALADLERLNATYGARVDGKELAPVPFESGVD